MTTEQNWYWSPMRPLGWVETIIKLLAFGFSNAALAMALAGTPGAPQLPADGLGMARFVAGCVLGFGLVVGIFDRYLDREIFAMIFIFANIAAHACFLYAVLLGAPETSIRWFPILMLCGDIVKITAIHLYNMRVRDIARWVLYVLTGVYLTGDVLMVLPTLVRM